MLRVGRRAVAAGRGGERRRARLTEREDEEARVLGRRRRLGRATGEDPRLHVHRDARRSSAFARSSASGSSSAVDERLVEERRAVADGACGARALAPPLRRRAPPTCAHLGRPDYGADGKPRAGRRVPRLGPARHTANCSPAAPEPVPSTVARARATRPSAAPTLVPAPRCAAARVQSMIGVDGSNAVRGGLPQFQAASPHGGQAAGCMRWPATRRVVARANRSAASRASRLKASRVAPRHAWPWPSAARRRPRGVLERALRVLKGTGRCWARARPRPPRYLLRTPCSARPRPATFVETIDGSRRRHRSRDDRHAWAPPSAARSRVRGAPRGELSSVKRDSVGCRVFADERAYLREARRVDDQSCSPGR